MPPLDDKQKSGVAFIGSLLGEQFGETFKKNAEADEFAAPITRMAASWAFHDAWQHEGLQRREKSLVIISALIATRQFAEVKNHVKIGVVNGLTPSELEGLLIQLAPYLGFPCLASATTSVIEALREIGISLDGKKTSEEEGLL